MNNLGFKILLIALLCVPIGFSHDEEKELTVTEKITDFIIDNFYPILITSIILSIGTIGFTFYVYTRRKKHE